MPELLTRVINFWSGPGAGKSTTKAGVFFELKAAGQRAAQIEEYATERSFEQDWATLSNQRVVTCEQERRQRRLLGKVNWIVTDSPLLLACVFGKGRYATTKFQASIWRMFDSYDNVNIWVDRVKPYQLYGRHHSEDEALALDQRLIDLVGDRIHFRTPGDEQAPQRVVSFLRDRYEFERV